MIRLASTNDISAVRRVYREAKRYMDAHGNPNQWTDGYPGLAQIERDIDGNALYVLEENGAIYAAFALLGGEEPAYAEIDGPGWRSDTPYCTLHRVGSDGTRHGVFQAIAAFAKTVSPYLRIDTHRDNQTMQSSVVKAGFVYAGVVLYPDVGERLAYDYIDAE